MEILGGLFLLGLLSFTLPQAWAPWGLLAFRRDWRAPRIAAAALLAATVQVVGGVGMGWGVWRLAESSRTVSLLALALVLTGVWLRARGVATREEIYRQGRSTRWPILLALLLTGPSELLAAALAWLAIRYGISGWELWPLAWGIGAFVGATLNTTLAQKRLEIPGKLDLLLPARAREIWLDPAVWVPATAAVALALVALRA